MGSGLLERHYSTVSFSRPGKVLSEEEPIKNNSMLSAAEASQVEFTK